MSEAPCRQPPLKCLCEIVRVCVREFVFKSCELVETVTDCELSTPDEDLEPWLRDIGTRLSPKKSQVVGR